jgi:hypothetical protein
MAALLAAAAAVSAEISASRAWITASVRIAAKWKSRSRRDGEGSLRAIWTRWAVRARWRSGAGGRTVLSGRVRDEGPEV